MAESHAMDAALVATLAGDAALAALTPDGVFFEIADQGATHFLLLSLLTHVDTYIFEGSAYELFTYLVKAVMQDTSAANAETAAARMLELLKPEGSLTPVGYAPTSARRSERIRITELDVSSEVPWQHSGGHYDVLGSPV